MAYNAGAADLHTGKGCRIKATWVKLYTMWYFFTFIIQVLRLLNKFLVTQFLESDTKCGYVLQFIVSGNWQNREYRL